jgi:hypothetical protein
MFPDMKRYNYVACREHVEVCGSDLLRISFNFLITSLLLVADEINNISCPSYMTLFRQVNYS